MITKADLFRLLEDWPDDTDIVAHAGDFDYYELHPEFDLAATDDNPRAVTFVMGQPINADLDLDNRTEEGRPL